MSKNRAPLWREAQLEVKIYKTRGVRIIFRSQDVEKKHAAASSQNMQITLGLDHFSSQDVENVHAAVAKRTI